jgi:hypothetical protein
MREGRRHEGAGPKKELTRGTAGLPHVPNDGHALLRGNGFIVSLPLSLSGEVRAGAARTDRVTESPAQNSDSCSGSGGGSWLDSGSSVVVDGSISFASSWRTLLTRVDTG